MPEVLPLTSQSPPIVHASSNVIAACSRLNWGSALFATGNGDIYVKSCFRLLEELALFCTFNKEKDAGLSIGMVLLWFLTQPRAWFYVARTMLGVTLPPLVCINLASRIVITAIVGAAYAVACLGSTLTFLSISIAQLAFAVSMVAYRVALLHLLRMSLSMTNIALSSVVNLHLVSTRLDRNVQHCCRWHADWLHTVRLVVVRALNGARKKPNPDLPNLPASWLPPANCTPSLSTLRACNRLLVGTLGGDSAWFSVRFACMLAQVAYVPIATRIASVSKSHCHRWRP